LAARRRRGAGSDHRAAALNVKHGRRRLLGVAPRSIIGRGEKPNERLRYRCSRLQSCRFRPRCPRAGCSHRARRAIHATRSARVRLVRSARAPLPPSSMLSLRVRASGVWPVPTAGARSSPQCQREREAVCRGGTVDPLVRPRRLDAIMPFLDGAIVPAN
jgi:hypothetical protein